MRVLAGALAAFLLAPPAGAAETKSFVVTWVGQAMYSQDGDCPDGVNPRWAEQRLRNLRDLGYSGKEIEEMVKDELAGEDGMERSKIANINVYRGKLNGQPVNAYLYPSTAVDPKLHAIRGAKYAYGFNLDGKEGPASFEDPETHETGVDNEFGRAMGCMPNFRGTLANPPLEYAWAWAWKREGRSAWLITITGDDLSKDGDVTVSIDRAVERLRYNADGTPRPDMTYRIDPSPKADNVFAGKIKDGLVTLREPGSRNFSILYNPEFVPEFRMTKVQMRLRILPDRSLEAMIGGYQRWDDLYISFASGGKNNEDGNSGDLVGIYYLLKKYADADPDPATGLKLSISATWNLQGVPAFVAEPETASKALAH